MSTEIATYWDFLTENDIATDDEIRLVTEINGLTLEAMTDILYVRTGYRNLEQMEGEWGW
jgi:uncharacterized protein YajQ (UPF0234 family)